MPTKIESLTDVQIARFPEFIQRWTEIGLATAPADRPAAEEGIRLAYRMAGLEPPDRIVWCDSPFSQGLTRAIVFNLNLNKKRAGIRASVRASVWASVGASVWASVGDSVWASVKASVRASVGDSVRASVWDSVGDSVWASVWDSVGDSVRASVGDSVRASVWDSVWASVGASVGDSVGDSVRASVWASVWASVGDSVGDSVGASVRASVWASVWASVGASVRASVGDSVRASVWDSVWDSVGDSVRASVGASVRASVWASVWASVGASVRASVGDSVYGAHDASWLGFYDYFLEACGLSEQTRRLCGLWQVAKNAGWWLPHKNVCWISERHDRVRRDDRGRLHCEDGPALSYPDGWAIYSVGGVRVDEQIVVRPETQTVEQIRAESNAEVKRIRIERYGWPRYLDAIGATVLDERRNDIEATRESLMRTPDGLTVLVCACPSTARTYALEMPPGTETCEAAQSWQSGGLASRIINVA